MAFPPYAFENRRAAHFKSSFLIKILVRGVFVEFFEDCLCTKQRIFPSERPCSLKPWHMESFLQRYAVLQHSIYIPDSMTA